MAKNLRPSRPELEDLVPYDAKEVKAEVVLASNENPANLPGFIVAQVIGALVGWVCISWLIEPKTQQK